MPIQQKIPVYGKEEVFLDEKTGLLYKSHRFSETAGIHTHTFYEFFIVTEGIALHMINHAIQQLNPGDFVFIRPRDIHTYKFWHSENFHILNVGFSAEIFDSIRTFLAAPDELERFTRPEYPPVVHVDPGRLAEIIGMMEKVWVYMCSDSPQRATLYAKSMLSFFLTEYFFGNAEEVMKIHSSVPKWLTELLSQMQKIENLQEGFPKMIALSPVSKNHLCRVLKKEFGVTPTQYINEKRLEYAMYLLTETEEDIISVCYMCGFNNLSHFYHLFKEKYGTTPKGVRSSPQPTAQLS